MVGLERKFLYSPNTGVFRCLRAELLLDFIDPLWHVLVRESGMFYLPRLVVEVWIRRLVMAVLAMLPYWVLKARQNRILLIPTLATPPFTPAACLNKATLPP